MDGLETKPRRLGNKKLASGSTQQTVLGPVSPTIEERIGFECST